MALPALEAGHDACRRMFRALSAGEDLSQIVQDFIEAEGNLQVHLAELHEAAPGEVPPHRRAAAAAAELTADLQRAELALLAAEALADAELRRPSAEVPAAAVLNLASHLGPSAAPPRSQHAFNAAAAEGFRHGWGLPAPPQHLRSMRDGQAG